MGGASLIDQLVKNLPAMQETRVQFLGGEDPLEKEMATHSSILAWRIPWTEEPGRLQSMGLQRVRHDLSTKEREREREREREGRSNMLNTILNADFRHIASFLWTQD